MNELIFELAQQAEEYATTRHAVSNIALSVNSEKFVKKLAELIVRECMEQIDDGNSDHAGGNREAINRIKEHFGVE